MGLNSSLLPLIIFIIAFWSSCAHDQDCGLAHIQSLVKNLIQSDLQDSFKSHLYQEVLDPLEQVPVYGSQSVDSKIKVSTPQKISNFDQFTLISARRLLRAGLGASTPEGVVFQNAFTPFEKDSDDKPERRFRSVPYDQKDVIRPKHRPASVIPSKRRKRQADCTLTKYRSFDGSCNNIDNSDWGAVQQPFLRAIPSNYGDDNGAVRASVSGKPLPNARLISSSILSEQTAATQILSTFVMQWGQFLDHDLDLTPTASNSDGTRLSCCGADRDAPNCASIDTSADPFYSQNGLACLSFTRSRSSIVASGREQFNLNTAYIDASMIYGSDVNTANSLRTFSKGMLKTSPSAFNNFKPLLPLINDRSRCVGQEKNNRGSCITTGDVRGNEQLSLTVVHIIWLREHNRIAGRLATINPMWNDETLYQEARKIIGAFIQHITYDEFLPLLLGPDLISLADLEQGPRSTYFTAYNSSSQAGIINSFATAAFRFGHSLVPHSYKCFDSNFQSIQFNAGPLGRVSELKTRDAMLNPLILYQNASREDANIMDCLLRFLLANAAPRISPGLNGEIREHLLQLGTRGFGADLASFNIMRGRDHGLPGYTTFRNKVCRALMPDLKMIKSFDDLKDIIPDKTLAAVRKQYQHVDDMDLFPLGLAEFPLPEGGILGPVFSCILTLQFRNLKFSDSFWYENLKPKAIFTIRQLNEIRKMTLAKVVCQNSDGIKQIQSRAFMLPSNDLNPIKDCAQLPDINFQAWKA